MIFRFENPEYFWLLLLIPLLFWLKGKVGATAAIKFSAVLLAKRVSGNTKNRAGKFIILLRTLTLILLISAMARPQTGSSTSEIEASGIDIALVVDLSGSMMALDFELKGEEVTRLAAVKNVITDFIEKRPNDRIGLIAFATNPYIVSPNTLNHDWLQNNLDRLEVGLIEQGTNIGPAIGMSVNRLRKLENSKSRIVILLTDGKDSPPPEVSPIAYAETSAAFGIKVYTIAAGTNKPAKIMDPESGKPIRDLFGRYRTMRFDVDTEILQKISEITHAKFYRATDTESLKDIYDDIDKLEKTEVKLKFRSAYTDQFVWPLLFGLLVFILEQILSQTRFRKLP